MFQDITTKSKTALTDQKKLLTELEVKHKSSARLERQHHSEKIIAKNAVIKKLENEHLGRMNFMVTTCAQLVNDNVEAAADAAKSNAVASSTMEILSVRLEKLKANSEKIDSLRITLVSESRERYELAIENDLTSSKQDLEIQLQEMKDDYELKIRESTWQSG